MTALSIALVLIAAMATYIALEVLKRHDVKDDITMRLNQLHTTITEQSVAITKLHTDIAHLNEEHNQLRIRMGFNKRASE